MAVNSDRSRCKPAAIAPSRLRAFVGLISYLEQSAEMRRKNWGGAIVVKRIFSSLKSTAALVARFSLTLQLLVEEVRKMRNRTIQRSPVAYAQLRRWWWGASFAGSLLLALPAAAANARANPALINKFALNAYCAEAHSKSALLADGSVSYKQVADLASERALVEHPNVYSDSASWKANIVAMLDQYGDEPMNELCTENPGPQS